jgi:hypothetical protein
LHVPVRLANRLRPVSRRIPEGGRDRGVGYCSDGQVLGRISEFRRGGDGRGSNLQPAPSGGAVGIECRLAVQLKRLPYMMAMLVKLRGHMRVVLSVVLTISCMLGGATAVPAQNGITIVRDGNGNLVRNTGQNSVRGPGQVYGNNQNAAPTSTLGPTTPTNSRSRPGPTK